MTEPIESGDLVEYDGQTWTVLLAHVMGGMDLVYLQNHSEYVPTITVAERERVSLIQKGPEK